jgi:hypothetical protein
LKHEDYKALENLVGLVERTLLRTTLSGTYFEPVGYHKHSRHYNDETSF